MERSAAEARVKTLELFLGLAEVRSEHG
jgi:hypothetical protein